MSPSMCEWAVPTFGRHVAVEISEENGTQLFLPRGCAHGFLVLSETADFLYKCDEYYSPQDEIVVRWNDPALGIDWRISDPVLGPRDASAPLLADIPNLPSLRRLTMRFLVTGISGQIGGEAARRFTELGTCDSRPPGGCLIYRSR